MLNEPKFFWGKKFDKKKEFYKKKVLKTDVFWNEWKIFFFLKKRGFRKNRIEEGTDSFLRLNSLQAYILYKKKLLRINSYEKNEK